MYIKTYCVGNKFCFQFLHHSHGTAPASCITWNRNCLPAFIARVIIVNIFGGFQRIINIFKIKIVIVKLFHYLNNAKHREVLSEVTKNILPKKKEKRPITYPFLNCDMYIIKTYLKQSVKKKFEKSCSEFNLKKTN